MSTKERPELVGKRFLFVPSRRCRLPHLVEGQEEEEEGRSSSRLTSPHHQASTSRSRGGEEREEKRPKLSRIADWNWVSGVIRCATGEDEAGKDLQVRHATAFSRSLSDICLKKERPF